MIQLKEFDVILDIKKLDKVEYRDTISKKTISSITVVREDYLSNKLNIYLKDGLQPYLIGDNKVQIIFSKADNTIIEMTSLNNDIEVIDNVITCILSTNTISVADVVQAEVLVSDLDNRRLTSARFIFKVKQGLLSDEMISSTNEFSTLDSLINDANVVLGTIKSITIETSSTEPLDTGFWYDPSDLQGIIRR